MGDVDLVRSLGLGRVDCAAFARPDEPVHWSRHVRARLEYASPWEQEADAVESLLAFGRAQATPPVLMPQSDGDLLLVSRHRARLAEAFRFLLADAELVEDLADKARFSQLAQRLGLPVPPARLVRPSETGPGDVDLRFPIIVKPLTRWGAKWSPLGRAAKALHVESRAALDELWPRLAQVGLEVLAQEAVAGSEAAIESHHAYVAADGSLVADFTGRKIRTRPLRYGHSTSVVITAEPEVAAAGREVLARIGLRGVSKADFKRAPDGTLHLLEINPRFTLWHHPAAVAGVNVPALVYADLTGRPRPQVSPARPGVRWCLPIRDAQAVRAEGGSIRRWVRWAAGCEAISGLAWDDPLPFVAGTVGGVARRRVAGLKERISRKP